MPSGTSALMDMTDMTDWTEEDLEKEFADTEEYHRGEEEEVEGEEGETGHQRNGSTGRSPSSDRLSSTDSVTTTSDMQPVSGEEGKDGAMADSGGKKRKNSAQAVWKTVKKAGAEINQDTRKVFRFIGQKLHSRHGPRETKVKEIHILPGEEDDAMWARRIAGSAHSQSSSGSDPST